MTRLDPRFVRGSKNEDGSQVHSQPRAVENHNRQPAEYKSDGNINLCLCILR